MPGAGRRLKSQKFFGSFFQKRTEKDFFFEKKKQKTFDFLASGWGDVTWGWTKRVRITRFASLGRKQCSSCT
jgi:hypothetical protein